MKSRAGGRAKGKAAVSRRGSSGLVNLLQAEMYTPPPQALSHIPQPYHLGLFPWRQVGRLKEPGHILKSSRRAWAEDSEETTLHLSLPPSDHDLRLPKQVPLILNSTYPGIPWWSSG